jgi:hypothetical protein
MLNKDYKEMLQCLLEENVRFLLVGAYAVAVHGFPRATKDIDFFVWATPENAANLMRWRSRGLAFPSLRSRSYLAVSSSSAEGRPSS